MKKKQPDTLDEWAAILAPRVVLDTLADDEKTIEMVAAEIGKSVKIAGNLLLERERDGLLVSRYVRLTAGRHPVKAYRPAAK